MKNNLTRDGALPSFDETAAFHGHACPGLALGYRVALAAMRRLCAGRPDDEGLVAVVENNACGVDAVQFVCGCTFGKGNLVFRDHGKHVYSFFQRAAGKGIRIYAEPPEMDDGETAVLSCKPHRTADEEERLRAGRARRIDGLLSLPDSELLHIAAAEEAPPARARIHASIRCVNCGERMMETRACPPLEAPLCIPCADTVHANLV